MIGRRKSRVGVMHELELDPCENCLYDVAEL